MSELSSELIEKYSKECEIVGFKYLGRGSKNDYSLVKCLVCGDVNNYVQGHIRKGKVRCSNCQVNQWSNECLANGFKFLGKVDRRNSLCECTKCYHQDSYDQGAMRDGRVSCSNCLTEKWSNECSAQGFKFIEKVDGQNSLCECMECSHQDVYKQTHMRNGEVRCENCLVNQYKAIVKPGWEYVDKTVIKKNTHIILKHKCSENLVTVRSCSLLKGSYDCPNCSHTHFDEPSYFYAIKVTHNNQTIIKIGVANNTDRRFKQYGLPDDSTLEIIRIEPFPSKRLAITFESTMKMALKDFKVDNDDAKTIFTIQGHTEVYTEDALEVIEQLL